MRILVTGCAGFIGSNFVRWLRAQNHDVWVAGLDAFTYAGHRATMEDFIEWERFGFVFGDIRDAEDVSNLLSLTKPDWVVNFAAESHVDRSIEGPTAFVSSNVLGACTLLDECLRVGVGRFLQVSTDEVYGSVQPGEFPFREDSPLRPSSPYSASKTGADHLALAFNRTHGMDVVVTRCSNNYGPYQYPEKLLPVVIRAALQDKPIPVNGGGGHIRDWIYVDDHCRALWAVLNNGRAGEVYNVGGNGQIRNIDLVKMVLGALDKPESLIEFVEDRKGHDRVYEVDFSKVHGELGWQPGVELEVGLRKTIQWYVENDDWCERVLRP